MAKDKTEYQASGDGVGEVGEDFKMGSGGSQDGGNVLQGGGTGSTSFWFVYLGTFDGNVEEGRGYKHGFTEADYGETSATEDRP